MEFTLVYRGLLKANGKPEHKQDLRRVFHVQLKELSKHPSLQNDASPDEIVTYGYDEKSIYTFTQLGKFRFASLVNQRSHLVAELNINMLRPEAPGMIITKGGDIDNRLKTLLDSLRAPKELQELPKDDSPKNDEDPYFCLLEDDNLITKLSVVTDRLLEPYENCSEVQLMIHVTIKPTKLTYRNMGLV